MNSMFAHGSSATCDIACCVFLCVCLVSGYWVQANSKIHFQKLKAEEKRKAEKDALDAQKAEAKRFAEEVKNNKTQVPQLPAVFKIFENSHTESQALPVQTPQNATDDGKGQSMIGQVMSLIAPTVPGVPASTQDASTDVKDENESSEAGQSAQPQTQTQSHLFSEVTSVNYDDLAAEQFTKPMLIDLNDKNVDVLAAWKMDKETQSVITKWATSAKNQEEFKSSRKLREFIKDKSARQKTAMFLSAFHAAADDSLVDTSSVSASWDNSAFLWTLDVGFSSMAQTPSCASMCRYEIMGEVLTYLIDLTSVPATSDAANSIKKLKQFLSSETISRADLAKTCPKIFRARCKPSSLLYVPAGYLVVEAATQGPLCFGVMQSLFLKSDKEAYEHAIKINKADHREVKVMEDLLAKCFS